ncbi:hypothetical protein Verru16b_01613 [Lacunisphaera limnophila]|uniref:6-hydroxymethylpterin diphosphokinase MptE-like domain-containing protein n=1 Tax=Lacunisphaera limnophila TaxID=1838286 RepID=A0A1D8AUJ7_9BACT|nr:6-hydroxymethylpterin diphosphokinase MptE-like protein [Lacunisphaera limnophila]AOS44550.1 hypothetical protein Verru16b_01613 [Lacunisphaera limnophila]
MNPYRFAWAVAKDRLRWDLSRESWRSRSRLRALKNTQSGRKAVIVCNGPSLLKSDLSLLAGVYTFGLNKINLLFEQSDFRPSCVVSVNPHVITQNAAFYAGTELPLFLDSQARYLIPARPNVTFVHSSLEARVVADVSVSLNQGYTVTCVAMQLALHLGFDSVALIGCDHNFATKGPANAEVRADGADRSHFDPRYFSGGQKWNLPDLAASEYYYSQAATLYGRLGRKLWNCTEGGALELLPRCRLENFVRGDTGDGS